MDAIYTYIEDHAERALVLLERLCRQPSISAQGVGLEEMAELVVAVMQEYGLTAELLPTDGGPPLVYGEIPGRSPHTQKPMLHKLLTTSSSQYLLQICFLYSRLRNHKR